MRYFAAVLRVLLIVIWIRILFINGIVPGSIETCTWVAIIIVGVYFAIIAKFGVQAVSCPTCKWKECGIK